MILLSVDADQEVRVYPVGKKKRKQQTESIEEQLISMLDKSTKDLQRQLWKEQARGLVEVLTKLVHVIVICFESKSMKVILMWSTSLQVR